MDSPARPVVFPTLLLLAMAGLVTLVGGLHYAFADGGDPIRTRGNHVGGWIFLVTTVFVLFGILMVMRSSQNTRRALTVGLLTLVVAVSGCVAGQTAITNGGRCACEGG